MKTLQSLVLNLALTFCLAASAQAQQAKQDDVAAGRKLALLICANCHVVGADQEQTPILRPPAPSFASIAARSSLTEAYLRQLLGSNHAKLGRNAGMPNPELGEYQIDKLVAYVMSLKGQK
jgi:mono/diheme cytochrome c family protein